MVCREAPTEELLAPTALLDHLDEAGLQLLDGRDVVREDTHLAGLGGDVNLDDIRGFVHRLSNPILAPALIHTSSISSTAENTYLMRQGQAQLDLRDGLAKQHPVKSGS